jgi:hypothetical protein
MSNAELRAVKGGIVSDTAMAGSNTLVAVVSRLLSHSGIQFIDLRRKTSALPATVGKLIEEADAEDGQMLIPLNERSEFDGAELQPITGEQLAPSQSLWFSGYQALEPFIATWIPLPLLRFLGRVYGGELRLDNGPSNWVRLYIERPANGLRAAEELTAVLAIDANIDASIRIEQDDYLAPNNDDVVFAPIFKLVTEAANLSEFLSDAWFEAWLSRRYDAHVASQSAPVGKARSQPAKPDETPFALKHFARYISMLKVLSVSANIPQLQFIDVRSAHWRMRTAVPAGSPLARSVLEVCCCQHCNGAPLVRRGNQFRFDATAF